MPDIIKLNSNNKSELYPVVHREFVYDETTGLSLEEENFSIIVNIEPYNWSMNNLANVNVNIDSKYLKQLENSTIYVLEYYEPIISLIPINISDYKKETEFFNTINNFSFNKINNTTLSLTFHSIRIENRVNIRCIIYFKKIKKEILR